MIDIKDMFLVILYIVLIILVIVTIVLLVRMIKTLKKVDKVVDEIDTKVNALNGLFHIVDTTTDAISSFSNIIIEFITEKINKFLKKKERNIDE